MLRLMRKHATSWIIKIILFTIVLVFVLWGVGSFKSQHNPVVATVNDDTINLQEYRKAYNVTLEQLRKTFGNNLDENMIKMLQVKKRAIDRVIDQRLVIQETERLKIRLSDLAVSNTIMGIPAFQSQGVFDSNRYRSVLQMNQLAPTEFEIIQRESMLTNMIRTYIIASIKISDEEIAEWYNWNDAQVKVDYVFFDKIRHNMVRSVEKDIEAYYEQNKERYRTDPKIKARYLQFSKADYFDDVEVKEDEIQSYYELNKDDYFQPKTVHARHILFKLDTNETPEITEEKKKKALEVMQMAKDGEDFAELAKKYSEGPTKTKGGDLGFFKYEDMAKPFADKAFSMAAGEISDPVKTVFGWHIIKVEEVNEEAFKNLADLKPTILQTIRSEKAQTMAQESAQAVFDVCFEGDDMVREAENIGKEIEETVFFTRKIPDPAIDNADQFAAVAFSLQPMEISDVQNFDGNYYIIQVTDVKEPVIPQLNEIEPTVRGDMIKEKQDQLTHKDATDFIAEIKNGSTFDAALEKFKVEKKETKFLKRQDDIPEIGSNQNFTKAAFSLSASKKIVEEPIKGKDGYYVLKFKERLLPDPSKLENLKNDFKNELGAKKQQQFFDQWLQELRKKSKIEIKKEFL